MVNKFIVQLSISKEKNSEISLSLSLSLSLRWKQDDDDDDINICLFKQKNNWNPSWYIIYKSLTVTIVIIKSHNVLTGK